MRPSGFWGPGGMCRAPSQRTMAGVGVQEGLKVTAQIAVESSGVGVDGRPTTTRLRRTGFPSSSATSSNDGMLTTTSLPRGGTAIPIPCSAADSSETGGMGGGGVTGDGAGAGSPAQPAISDKARTATNLVSAREARIGRPRGVRW